MMTLKSEVFLASGSKEEEDYCNKYNIIRDRLDNGISIIGARCFKESTAHTQIEMEFQEGAFGNPPGAVHFLEHFFNKKARKIASKNDVYLQAYTSQTELGERLRGVSNPKHNNYGLWPVLPEIRRSLESPTQLAGLNDEIDSEKEIIKSEIKERESYHDFWTDMHYSKYIFSTDNPLHNIPTVAGTALDVDKINRPLLKNLESEILNPSNLVISFYTEGESELQGEIHDALRKLFSDFPKSEHGEEKLDRRITEKISSDAKAGSTSSFKHKLDNGLITHEFLWIFHHDFSSPQFFATRFLRSILASNLHDKSRKNGWGYSTSVRFDFPFLKLGVIGISITVRKQMKPLTAKEIREVIVSAKNEVPQFIKQEKLRQAAIPISTSDRFSWVEKGIKDFGGIIDADKVRSIVYSLKKDDYLAITDKMLNEEPIHLVTGDL